MKRLAAFSLIAFSLENAPAPAASLILAHNGMVMKQGLDYALTGREIAFVAAQTPQSGDVLLSWYRYTR
jgi:hypothetical protein